MAKKSDEGHHAARSLVEWATMGLRSALGETVTNALVAIAGECRASDQDWILFGEVLSSRDGPPFCAQVRRVSLLSSKPGFGGEQWTNFDLICPTPHVRVVFTAGMLIGVFTKPANRPGQN